MRSLYTPLTQEEAEPFVGQYFTIRDGKFNQRVAIVERVGKGGACWYREMATAVLQAHPEQVLPGGGRTIPWKLLVATEPRQDVKLVRSVLQYNEIPRMIGQQDRPVQIRDKNSVGWELTTHRASYSVIEDGYSIFSPTGF